MNPYWLEDAAVPRASPRHEGRVDVAIVGAGVTGCAAAFRLAEGGLRVRVHDQRAVAEGASGRNGGFALRGGASRYDVARDTYGREQASGMWRWTEHALDRIEALAGDALRRPGSYRLAADEEERDEIRLEYEALREDGIAAEWLDDLPGQLAGRFAGGIHHPGDGALQPARWVRRLAALAAEAGAEIREYDRVDDLARFFRALLGGELLRPGLLSEMTRTVYANPDARAGLGLFRIDLPCGSAWGHGGDEASYSDQVLVARDGPKVVVVAQHTFGWPSVEATAEELYCR